MHEWHLKTNHDHKRTKIKFINLKASFNNKRREKNSFKKRGIMNVWIWNLYWNNVEITSKISSFQNYAIIFFLFVSIKSVVNRNKIVWYSFIFFWMKICTVAENCCHGNQEIRFHGNGLLVHPLKLLLQQTHVKHNWVIHESIKYRCYYTDNLVQ